MLAVDPRDRGRWPARERFSDRDRSGSAVPGRLSGPICWVDCDTALPCDGARTAMVVSRLAETDSYKRNIRLLT